MDQRSWDRARRLHEEESVTFAEIARRFSIRRATVSARAKRERWIGRKELIAATAEERRAAIARAFVQRESAAIVDSLCRKSEAASCALDVIYAHLERLRSETLALVRRRGRHVVSEDPALVVRRLTAAL